MDHDKREQIYRQDAYYWGTEPNRMAEETVERVSEETDAVTVIDIGAGEGRDAVYFAEQGWEVSALDISPAGLQKAERLAERRNVAIETLQADVNTAKLAETFDVVYSAGTVQYIRPANRNTQFAHFQERTAPGGLHTIFAFVDHPDVPKAPDWTANEYFYEQGELLAYYDEWEIIEVEEVIFDDESGGKPHQHAAEIVTARKPTPVGS